MPSIRMIAVDMDGTLLSPSSTISPRNLRAMRRAAEAGITLAVCSGRAAQDISRFAREGDFPCYVSGCNGGEVLAAPFGPLLERFVFDAQTGLACIDTLRAEQIAANGFVPGGLVVMPPPYPLPMQETWTQECIRRGLDALEMGEEALREAVRAGRLIKLIAFEQPGHHRLARLQALLEVIPGVSVTSSWADNLEVMPDGISKGASLRRLAERLGIAREQVMAIGDQENDRSMLAWAGCPVAMGNAVPAIQALCGRVTASNAEDGVAQAIEALLGSA